MSKTHAGMLKDLNLRCRLVVRSGEENFLGPGRIELLEKIDRFGSISEAARDMGMSYRKAWGLVEHMNQLYREDLVVTQKGGKSGGGAGLTPTGRRLIEEYRGLTERLRQFLQTEAEHWAAAQIKPG